jgi:hypothetical protein
MLGHALQCAPGGTARALGWVLGLVLLAIACAAAYRWRHRVARRLPLYAAVAGEVRRTKRSAVCCLFGPVDSDRSG